MSSQKMPYRVHQTPCCCPPTCPGHPDYDKASATTSSPAPKPSQPDQNVSAQAPEEFFWEALLAGRYDEQIRGLRPRRHKMSGQSATNQDSKVSPAHMSKDQMEAATKAPSSEPPKFADKYDFFPVPTWVLRKE